MGHVSRKDNELRAIIVMGSIIGGMEAGFLLPEPGEDVKWVETNLESFRTKASQGDEDFVQTLKEIEGKQSNI